MHANLKGSLPLNARLDHITGHEFEPLLQVLAELCIRPVQVPNERLQSVQLPEEVLGGSAAIALLLEALVDRLGDRRLHQVDVTHHQWCEGLSQMCVEATILQVIYTVEYEYQETNFSNLTLEITKCLFVGLFP